MKVVYTEQSIASLEQSLQFSIENLDITKEKASSIKEQLFDRADSLSLLPHKGQFEEYLKHLKEDHRRIIEGHYKIIYKVENEIIYITDFFDSRQDPIKMRG